MPLHAAVECPLPRYIRYASMSGNNTFKSVLTVTCDRGYFMHRGINTKEVVCMKDTLWSEDLYSIICIRKLYVFVLRKWPDLAPRVPI